MNFDDGGEFWDYYCRYTNLYKSISVESPKKWVLVVGEIEKISFVIKISGTKFKTLIMKEEKKIVKMSFSD